MPEDLTTPLTRILVEDLGAEASHITQTSTLNSLDLDSLAVAELVLLNKEQTGADLSREEAGLGDLTLCDPIQLVSSRVTDKVVP
ncbi:phosphopantetheine-binding protein [Streptomyces sp. NPDC058486]|uniref:phosphopantetheine-binding protein n=1 Tax=unclassified Streptomyces TaxID=2593676 RepID=UPI0036616BE0